MAGRAAILVIGWLLTLLPALAAMAGSASDQDEGVVLAAGRVGRVLAVGPGKPLARPSDAAAKARNGDTVEIAAGDYAGDVASWPQSNLIIRGVGGVARIDAQGSSAEGKAVWVIKGGHVTIENVELTGCQVDDHNGAGIRAEGRDLTLTGVSIHGNEMGVLTAQSFRGELLVQRSEIYANTVDYDRYGSLGHNIYVSRGADRLTVQGSWIHGAVTGHNVKSRAKETRILYNLIEDGPDGAASYQIDIPEGTPALILGNVLSQGPEPQNDAMVSFASESGRAQRDVPVYLVSNTAMSASAASVLLRNQGASSAHLLNNALSGIGRALQGRGDESGDQQVAADAFADAGQLDLTPRPGSSLLDRTVGAPSAFGMRLVPGFQYLHPHGMAPRVMQGASPDVGAFEAGG